VNRSRGFNLEAGWQIRNDLAGRFQQPQGWPTSANEVVWMFDNEIDWVTRLEMPQVRREARERRKILNTFEYKAEHMQSS
jgi:hypothetical protein